MTSKRFGNIIHRIGKWWHQDAVQPIDPVTDKEVESEAYNKEVESTALDSIDIKMRTGHVTIEMDQSFAEQQRLEHKEKMSLVDDKYRSERSLRQYYLGCSCSVCYQRYHISKGYHCCDSKSRCNVRRYVEELEDSVDSHSAPVERKIETMNKIPEEIVRKVDEVALGRTANDQQNDSKNNEETALVDSQWLQNENSEMKRQKGRDEERGSRMTNRLDESQLDEVKSSFFKKRETFTNILELSNEAKDKVIVPSEEREVSPKCTLRRYSFSKRSDKYIKALTNNRKEREKAAGEKMKKIREAFRKLREKDFSKSSTKIDPAAWIPPSEENDQIPDQGLLPCGNFASMQFLSEAFLIFIGTLVIAGIVVRLFYGNGLITI